MKVKVESFKIVCDCCGETFHDGNDFVCYTDDADGSQINEEAESAGWIEIGDEHFCPDCFSFGDDDNIVIKNGRRFDHDTHKEIMVG